MSGHPFAAAIAEMHRYLNRLDPDDVEAAVSSAMKYDRIDETFQRVFRDIDNQEDAMNEIGKPSVEPAFGAAFISESASPARGGWVKGSWQWQREEFYGLPACDAP